MCYTLGEEEQGLYGFNRHNPRQAFIHAAGTPDTQQYSGWILLKSVFMNRHVASHRFTVRRCAGSRKMRRSLVKRHSYREHDYLFGQLILTLRTSIGLTQAGLDERLGVSRRAVAEWETGLSYPKAERLQQLITLCMQQKVFAAGREDEEIRALWRAARQKVLLDEDWLRDLLGPPAPIPLFPQGEPQVLHTGSSSRPHSPQPQRTRQHHVTEFLPLEESSLSTDRSGC